MTTIETTITPDLFFRSVFKKLNGYNQLDWSFHIDGTSFYVDVGIYNITITKRNDTECEVDVRSISDDGKDDVKKVFHTYSNFELNCLNFYLQN